ALAAELELGLAGDHAGKARPLAQRRRQEVGAALRRQRAIETHRAVQESAREQAFLRRPRRLGRAASPAAYLGAQRGLPFLQRHARPRQNDGSDGEKPPLPEKTTASAVWAASVVPCAMAGGTPVGLLQASPVGFSAGGLHTAGADRTPLDSYRARGWPPITQSRQGKNRRLEAARIFSGVSPRNSSSTEKCGAWAR